MESDVMPLPQSSAASGKDKPEEVMLKDVLKLSSLIVALTAGVLLILSVWYLFVLKPALSQSNQVDIRLTEKLPSDTPVSQELEFKTEVETQLTSEDVEPSNEVFGNDEKSETEQRNNTTRRAHSTQRHISIKSAKSNIARSEKEPMAQSQESPRHQNEYKEEEDMRIDEDREENKDEDTAQKIKSFAVKLKESFLTPSTQSICTQVQIAMNQCSN